MRVTMRLFALILVMPLVLASLAPAGAGAGFDPLAMYGPELRFRVFRNGEEIGSHTVSFRQDGESVHAAARFDIAVRLLGIAVFRFDYRSDAVWQGGTLQRLAAEVNDDGTARSLQAHRHGDSVIVEGPRGLARVVAPLWPSNHWHPGVLVQTRVLNTLTGGIDQVSIAEVGRETVSTNAGPVSARHFRYSGDLHDVDAWYDPQGRWVRLRFLGTDGTPVDYVCEICVRAR